MAWQLMQRLHCTYTELMQQPFEEMLVLEKFIQGEAQAERQEIQQQASQERVNVVG